MGQLIDDFSIFGLGRQELSKVHVKMMSLVRSSPG